MIPAIAVSNESISARNHTLAYGGLVFASSLPTGRTIPGRTV